MAKKLVTLDFETFWDSKDKYTLTKMGAINYIRDARFEPMCVAVGVNRDPVIVVEGAEMKDYLESLHLDEEGTVTVGHNISGFDGLILSEYYGIHPWRILDTIPLMCYLGLSSIISCSHKALTELLGHGFKAAGTVLSDGKHRGDFTDSEWEWFKKYCWNDCNQCRMNFISMITAAKQYTSKENLTDALDLIDITARMATDPAFVPSKQALTDYVGTLNEGTQAWLEKLRAALFFDFKTTDDMLKAIRSRTEFPKLLMSLGVHCPMKHSEKQGKDIPAISKTDLAFTALLKHPDERVRLLVKARLEQNSSIQKSRAENLLKAGGDLPVPISLQAFKAHTGRYTAGTQEGSDGLNFQNMSKRDPNQLAIRKAIRVPDGYTVLACDSSQIEARMLAWVAGQDDLVEQFREGRDPYAELASKIFNVPADVIHKKAKDSNDPEHNKYKSYRNTGKTGVLSAGYGVGAKKFSDTLLRQGIQLDPDLQKHEAMAFNAHRVYRSVNWAIVKFWDTCSRMLSVLASYRASGEHYWCLQFGRDDMLIAMMDKIPCTEQWEPCVVLPNGFHMWYPNLRVTDDGLVYDRVIHGKATPTRIYGGLLTENICQALAFDMLYWQAVRIHRHGIEIKANIHDCWIAVVPDDRAEADAKVMESVMRTVPDWLKGFPVDCECESGHDFTIA